MIPVLRGQRALDLLREVAASDPDASPPSRYVRDRQPCCIVGHVLARHGIPIREMADWDTAGSMSGSIPIGTVLMVPMDGVAKELLAIAQDAQDDDGVWSEALAEAEVIGRIRGLT